MKITYANRLSPVHLASIDLLISEGEWYWITRVYVPHKYRRQGVATALMKKVLKDADREGVTLWVQPSPHTNSVSMEVLVSWYQKLGFEFTPRGYMERLPNAANCSERTKPLLSVDRV